MENNDTASIQCTETNTIKVSEINDTVPNFY